MVETVVSVIQSASGDSFVSKMLSMSSAEWRALATHRDAANFFKHLPRQIAAWTSRIQQLRRAGELTYLKDLARLWSGNVAFESAVAKLAAEEAMISHAARIAAANAAAAAAEGTLVVGTGTLVVVAVVPVVAMVAVAVALGSGYYEAREEAKKAGFVSGFAKGFITGLLKWELRFTIDRFWDNALSKNGFDESLPAIYADAHNNGLLKGRMAGLAKDADEKQQYLKALKKLTNASAEGWTPRSDDWREKARARQVQTTYVIEFAVAAQKHGILAVG